MERRSLDLDHLLDEPFVQVLPNGRSLRMNRAFRELAVACQAEAELASIFGPSVHDLLSEADANGRAGAYLAALGAPSQAAGMRATGSMPSSRARARTSPESSSGRRVRNTCSPRSFPCG